MNGLEQHLHNAVHAYMARNGMAATRLGMTALGDPTFVHRLLRGRVPRLDTADRLLVFMGEEPVGPAFRREVEAFIATTGTKPYVLGLDATGDPSFVRKLRQGVSPRLATADRVRTWMNTHASDADQIAIRRSLTGGADAAAMTDPRGETCMTEDTFLYMSTREVAAFLGLSPRTLDRYRVTGDGPPFHRFGNRVRYTRADVVAWAEARRFLSTSDDGSAREALR